MKHFSMQAQSSPNPSVRLSRLWSCMALALLFASLLAPAAIADSSDEIIWLDLHIADPPGAMGFDIGVYGSHHDGYDGQIPVRPVYYSGVCWLLYRENGVDWAGLTGFYQQDFESPIPPGTSKTWWDIYMWSQNYTPEPTPPHAQARPFSQHSTLNSQLPFACFGI